MTLEKHISLLDQKAHNDPHSFLGLKKDRIRVFYPKKENLFLSIKNKKIKAKKVHPIGLFEHKLDENILPKDYKIIFSDRKQIYDPYAFLSSDILEKKLNKFLNKKYFALYDILGVHSREINGIKGLEFTLFAPHALGVSIIGSFNDWNGKVNFLRKIENVGLWHGFIPELAYGSLYKFEITTREKKVLTKSDPFAFFSELRPHNSSITYDLESFNWKDQKWLEKRNSDLNKPINIYEVHLQSWMKGETYFLNYKNLAINICKYVKEMGYNYIEIMPLMEHPLDDSFGYQVTGFFSITSRYGTPDDFKFFVNHMHENNIGVILDWVPSHFCSDEFGLDNFDGKNLFEIKKGHEKHPIWKSNLFDYKNLFVQNFLISSAIFYLEKYHIDGLRVDAVSSMLYLDHAIEKDFQKNEKKFDNLNIFAINFLKNLNYQIKKKFPDVLTIAEESTAFKDVTKKQGLGFDLKWNLGWSFDVVKYFKLEFFKKTQNQNILTFLISYAFSENFVLPFSHDDVSEDKSLFNKIFHDDTSIDIDDKFAIYRLLYSFLICQSGKKLTFMGIEIAETQKWDNFKFLNWDLLKNERNKNFKNFVKDINFLYLKKEALWEDDFSEKGFEWVDFSDNKNSIISYLRKSHFKKLLIIHNFSNNNLKSYQVKLKKIKSIREVFNTNSKKYGGSTVNFQSLKISKNMLYLDISKLTTLIFEVTID